MYVTRWKIDHSTGRPILTLDNCSVIEAEDAEYQLGGVQGVAQMARNGMLGNIDLLMGGSPCQGFSKAGANQGFDDPRSKLLFEFLNIKAHLKPRWWLLENVRMKQSDQDLISALIGVKPVEINSALFSAQNRKRLYWTNIPIAAIVDAGIMFWMIREYDVEKQRPYKMKATPSRIKMWSDGIGSMTNAGKGICANITHAEKAHTLTIKQDRCPNSGLVEFDGFGRYLTHNECERLQTLPDEYTRAAKPFQRYSQLGNGWTVDVIAHILRGIKN